MLIRKARQILKTFADDTRLRIVNLLNIKELTVTELCKILNKNQSNISKHLTRLRLTSIVGDKREGSNVYYHLIPQKDKPYMDLLRVITVSFSNLKIFKEDLRRLGAYTKRINIKKSGKGGVK